MKTQEISYKDLSKSQLDILKDVYVESRVKLMSNEEIKDFVKTILEDQIKGTVGNEEEREAWKEMKDFFKNEFNQQIELVKQKCPSSIDLLADPKQDESDRRMELLEKRKEENEQKVKDMW